MSARRHGDADFFEMQVHSVRIAERQDEPRTLAFSRTDGAEDVGPIRTLIVGRARPRSTPCPAPRDFVLLAYARFVLKPDFDFGAFAKFRPDLRHLRREVFLKASRANSFCSW